MPRFWESSISFRFPHRNPVSTSLPQTCYTSRQSHSCSYHPGNIWRGVQATNIVTAEFPLVARYLVPLRHKYSPQHPIL